MNFPIYRKKYARSLIYKTNDSKNVKDTAFEDLVEKDKRS